MAQGIAKGAGIGLDEPELAADVDPGEGGRDDGLFVASLAKGMKVLECFSGGQQGLNLTEIAALTDIGKSAAQRAVATLHALGYLRRNERDKTYRLSPKVLSLSRNYLAGSDLVEAAMPFLRRCNQETDETVNLSEMDGVEIVCIARIHGRQVVTINIGVGSRFPAYSTAPGLVMLAFSEESECRRILAASEFKAFTKQTVTREKDLLNWIQQIRGDGYAIADQLMYEGEYSVAAPVLGVGGRAVAAVNVSAPTSRWSFHDLRSKVVPVVVETARQVTAAISS